MNPPPLDLTTLDKRTLGNAKLRGELLDLFRQHAVHTLSTLQTAVLAHDGPAAVAAAHRLKGSAATVAAGTLALAAAGAEAAAASGDWSAAAAGLEPIESELARCLTQIDGLLADEARRK